MTKPVAKKSLREQRAEKRINEILEAALYFFTTKGYEQTSMEEIAKEALLTRAGLYKYFSDKASLLSSLRQSKVQELQRRLERSLKDQNDCEEKLKIYIQVIYAFQTEHPGAFRVMFSAASIPELRQENAFKPINTYLLEILNEAQSLGKMTKDISVDELSPMIASLFLKNDIAQNLLGYSYEARLERDIWLLERLLLKGIQP